jgi:hypothetical protein
LGGREGNDMSSLRFLRRTQVRSEPDLSKSVAPFWEGLRKTIAWCLPKIDVASPATCLRSPATRPRLFTTNHLNTAGEALRHRYPTPEPVTPVGDLHGGRLLLYFPDLDLCDGAAEAESQGFLDVNNAPPWDCWVAFLHYPDDPEQSHLVAWVPSEFIQLADAGIRVNPEECVKWLVDSDIDLKKQIS